MSLTYVIKESFSNSESFEERSASVPFISVQNQTEKETNKNNDGNFLYSTSQWNKSSRNKTKCENERNDSLYCGSTRRKCKFCVTPRIFVRSPRL